MKKLIIIISVIVSSPIACMQQSLMPCENGHKIPTIMHDLYSDFAFADGKRHRMSEVNKPRPSCFSSLLKLFGFCNK